MKLSRRDAIRVSGTTMAGLSMGVVNPNEMLGQGEAQEWPDHLETVELPGGFPVDLPLMFAIWSFRRCTNASPFKPPRAFGPNMW